MKILLFGSTGQVGRELARSLACLGELTIINRKECDLSDAQSLIRILNENPADIIVNSTAYTQVDRAEEEQSLAIAINATAVQHMAEAAKKQNALFVHYSTDYVFDGTKSEPYQETDPPNPLSVYGKSKLLGEQAVAVSGCDHLIFRTSWVYAAHGKNFPKTMLRLAAEGRDELKVVDDQIGAPTSAALIADVTVLILHRLICEPGLRLPVSGVYHLVAQGETSWYGFAQALFDHCQQQGKQVPKVVLPISTKSYAAPAPRPLNSRLCTKKLCQTFKITLPHWSWHVDGTFFHGL
jgi:dTDP-4-dehydrorhamnose reductase